MSEENALLSGIRRRIMNELMNFTEKSYVLLRQKQSLSPEEWSFLQEYENYYLLNILSIITAIPAFIYQVRYLFGQFRSNQSMIRSGSRGLKIFFPFTMAFMLTGQIYDWQLEVSSKAREFEDYVRSNSGTDIDSLNFRYSKHK